MDTPHQLNQHLEPIFKEVLPALTNAGIRYWVFGGVAVAGVADKFLRENQDIDVYVLEEDFNKIEPVLKKLCEEHGGWDADDWTLRYQMLKSTSRPKFDIFVKNIERFSVIPVYKVASGFEFRLTEVLRLPESAIELNEKSIDGFSFNSAPIEVLKMLLSFLIEGYIKHRDPVKPIPKDSKYLIDARILFSEEEINNYMKRLRIETKTT